MNIQIPGLQKIQTGSLDVRFVSTLYILVKMVKHAGLVSSIIVTNATKEIQPSITS